MTVKELKLVVTPLFWNDKYRVKFLESATVKLMYALRLRPTWLGDVELFPPEGALSKSFSL
jgi:hypothetical protein